MASASKHNNVLHLFLENSPLQEWHFEQIRREAKITRAAASKWLKQYQKEGIIKRIKRKGKFPFFTVGNNNAAYYARKRMYALQQLHESGLLQALIALNSAKTIIIFGSMIKGDWYKDSDIDIFIYGNASDLSKHTYEKKIGKSIELHVFENTEDIHKVRTGLVQNILNGYVVKGTVQDVMGSA